ncbi:hypothetical protein MVEN_00937400 [Mycena venus]|uniref:Uncharacterized protein n=1 Tax=Mycena venus TaxID=2733690 RepID=A0A8H6YDK1_9AGAR|nr:hypothetical protein MVEN_00937400 [Mycena venus]
MSSDSDPPVSTLSDEDNQLLFVFGRTVTQDAIGIIWETLFLSAYGVFFCLAVWTIVRKGLKTAGSITMLTIVVYLYSTSLTLWALTVTSWFRRAHAFFMDHPELSLADRRELGNDSVAIFGTPMEALFMFNMIVGDSVVIWRAWVLYSRSLWVMALPCLMLTMSFVFMVIDLICLTGAGFSNQTAIASGGPVCDRAELISWAFSFVTNGTCTILIGYKAWQHRRSTRALGNSTTVNSTRMSTNRILSLLVESGFIYCLFWLTQYILFVDVTRDAPIIYVYELFSGMGDQISGMYPALIIVIVNLHQTLWDAVDSPSANGSSLHFTNGAKRTDTNTIGPGPFGSQRGVSSTKLQLVNTNTNIDTGGAMAMSIVGKSMYSPTDVHV